MLPPDDTAGRSKPGGLLRRRLLEPIAAQLKQGISPEKIALSLAVGLVLATCPILGVTTALCALAAAALRLNHVAIQLVNYAAYPLQLALLLPFWRLGASVFNAARVPLSPSQVAVLFRVDFWGASALYLGTALRAAAVWALVAPIAIYLLYRLLAILLRRFAAR
jgi:uncharacterized protein (DUF2062 family)